MSVDYAAGLSHCDDLGICGLDEVFDKPEVVSAKVKQLAEWMRLYEGSCVVHVGAGLSTAAGIRDFRGKAGVWTELQKANSSIKSSHPASQPQTVNKLIKDEDKSLVAQQVEAASQSSSTTGEATSSRSTTNIPLKAFDETEPTYSHMTLKTLCQLNYVKHIVSQNVDGLFLKSNLKRCFISELHGDFYLDECTKCRSRFIRGSASQSMRLQRSTVKCPRGQACKGHLRDTILDWESPIPYNELRVATRESKQCRLHICIGTSLQLRPSMDLICNKQKAKQSKLVIINLQPTKFDQKADLVINYYADDVMKYLADELDVDVPKYDASEDPTKNPDLIGTMWTRGKHPQEVKSDSSRR